MIAFDSQQIAMVIDGSYGCDLKHLNGGLHTSVQVACWSGKPDMPVPVLMAVSIPDLALQHLKLRHGRASCTHLKKRCPPNALLSAFAVLPPSYWFRDREVAD